MPGPRFGNTLSTGLHIQVTWPLWPLIAHQKICFTLNMQIIHLCSWMKLCVPALQTWPAHLNISPPSTPWAVSLCQWSPLDLAAWGWEAPNWYSRVFLHWASLATFDDKHILWDVNHCPLVGERAFPNGTKQQGGRPAPVAAGETEHTGDSPAAESRDEGRWKVAEEWEETPGGKQNISNSCQTHLCLSVFLCSQNERGHGRYMEWDVK